jgi:hypothetical protein
MDGNARSPVRSGSVSGWIGGADPARRLARERDRARAGVAQHLVAYAFQVDPADIAAPTRRSPDAAFARQAAMYLTHVVFEMSLARVADAFGRDRTTAAHACHRIEDGRDDPAFDALMDRLETVLRSLPRQSARPPAPEAGRAA